jgi:hypothetical protein
VKIPEDTGEGAQNNFIPHLRLIRILIHFYGALTICASEI